MTTPVSPPRGLASVFMLLGLVLAVTAQLVTGFVMMAHFNAAWLMAHIAGGIAAIVLTLAEWAWLALAPAGRFKLRGFFARGSGPKEWSEGLFLIVATVTVVFGALLAAIMYWGTALPFATLLTTHQALAIAVAVIYLAHSALSMRRKR
jgi:hypothetical protein